jgi:hypothetical protein
MATVSTNTRIDTINILDALNSVQNTDLLLVQRDQYSYKLPISALTLDDSKIIVQSPSLTSINVNNVIEELANLLTTKSNTLSSSISNLSNLILSMPTSVLYIPPNNYGNIRLGPLYIEFGMTDKKNYQGYYTHYFNTPFPTNAIMVFVSTTFNLDNYQFIDYYGASADCFAQTQGWSKTYFNWILQNTNIANCQYMQCMYIAIGY